MSLQDLFRWTATGALTVTATLLLPAGATTAAQQRPPATPNPLGQPLLDAPGVLKEEAFLEVPLRSDDQKYGDMDGRYMKRLVEDVVAISLKDRDRGTVFWGRNVGTQAHVETQDWLESHFRKHGLQDVRRQQLDLAPQWTVASWDLTFSSGGQVIPLKSARPARLQPSIERPLELELVWVGTGTSADFLDRTVKGKAVLIQDIPLPGELRHSIALQGSVRRAFENGAAAVGVVYGISDNFSLWERIDGGPGFNLGFEDGKEVRERLGRGETVKVSYRISSEMREGLKTAHVWGTLPGTTDEDITIVAHMDGYFHSALDNASGLAVMVGLVEHFAKVPQAQRRRGIRFMGSAGHHGGPGARWLHDNRDTALAKTALVINLEHVAVVRTKYWGEALRKTTAVSPMRWWVWGSDALLDIALDTYRRFNIGITADMDTSATGEIGWLDRDAPSIQLISSPEIKHTEQELLEWIPASGLQQVARAYARIIDEVNRLDRSAILPAAPASQGGGD